MARTRTLARFRPSKKWSKKQRDEAHLLLTNACSRRCGFLRQDEAPIEEDRRVRRRFFSSRLVGVSLTFEAIKGLRFSMSLFMMRSFGTFCPNAST